MDIQQPVGESPISEGASVVRVGKLKASWMITKASWGLLMRDKEILFFPVISMVASMVVLASFLIAYFFVFAGGSFETLENTFGENSTHVTSGAEIAFWFVFYLILTFVVAFFEACIIAIVSARLNGQNFSFSEGVRGASAHVGKLFVWSAVNATVGIIIRTIAERSETLGRIVMSMVGIAWSIMTYFIIPTLMFENLSVGDSIRRSASIFKQKWGETLVVNAGVNFLIFIFIILGLFAVIALAFMSDGALLLPAIILYVVLCFVFIFVASALNSIFRVVLYMYATRGTLPGDFPPAAIQSAFVAKK